MAKFLLGLLTGLALVVLSFVLLLIIAFRFREKPPEISNDSVLVARLEGDIPEKSPVELPAFLGGDKPGLTITGVWSNLHKAAVDPRIKALVLEPEHLSAGWAKLE